MGKHQYEIHLSDLFNNNFIIVSILKLIPRSVLTDTRIAELLDQRGLVSGPLGHQIHLLSPVFADIQAVKMASDIRIHWRFTLYGILFRSHHSHVQLGKSPTP